MSGTLSSSTIVARKGGLIESEIDREIVALNIESGVCYGLNKMGSRIWALLGTPVRISDICTVLVSEYDVEPEACETEVIALIEQLLEEDLVVTKDPT